MKVDWMRLVLLGCLAVILVQCGSTSPPPTPGKVFLLTVTDTHKQETNPVSTTPDQLSSLNDLQIMPTASPLVNSSIQNLIEMAKQDLAHRLSISVTQISLVDVNDVVWPDASLGCPQPGMAYADVLTPGYLIFLQTGNTKFEYHASRGTTITYCEDPSPPVLGTPDDI